MLDRLWKMLKYAKNEKQYIQKFRNISQIYCRQIYIYIYMVKIPIKACMVFIHKECQLFGIFLKIMFEHQLFGIYLFRRYL